MKRSSLAICAHLFVLAGLLGAGSVAQAATAAGDTLDVYTGIVGAGELSQITALGVDRHELKLTRTGQGRGKQARFTVETILSGRQAEALGRQGVVLAPKKVAGATASQRATAQAAKGFEVFRRYSGVGGLRQEFVQVAHQYPSSRSS